MFMEAVLESLKDLELRHPLVNEPSSNGGSDFPAPAPKNDQEDSFSTRSNSVKIKSITTSVAEEHKLAVQMPLPDSSKLLLESPPKCTPFSKAITQETCSLTDTPASNSNLPNSEITDSSSNTITVANNLTSNDAEPHPVVAETSEATSHSDKPSGSQSTSDAEVDDHTRVTVKVVKNPTNTIMEGLLRRWYLNFFQNR